MKNENSQKYIQTYYTKINVYYHIWAPADTDMWKLMVDEQIKRLYRSGLSKVATVKCAINGPRHLELLSLFLSMIGLIFLVFGIVMKSMRVLH